MPIQSKQRKRYNNIIIINKTFHVQNDNRKKIYSENKLKIQKK